MVAVTRTRALFGGFFIMTGSMHFVAPGYFVAVVPPYLPSPSVLVAVSGVAEMAGGVGILLRRWRAAAAIGLIALLVAVFPANIEMLRQARARDASPLFEAALWLRLPVQLLLIWLAWRLRR